MGVQQGPAHGVLRIPVESGAREHLHVLRRYGHGARGALPVRAQFGAAHGVGEDPQLLGAVEARGPKR